MKSKIYEIKEMLGTELYGELLVIFDEQLRDIIVMWMAHLNSPNYQQISADAHKIKSSARNIGAEEMATVFHSIERDPQKNFNLNSITQLKDRYNIFKLEAIDQKAS